MATKIPRAVWLGVNHASLVKLIDSTDTDTDKVGKLQFGHKEILVFRATASCNGRSHQHPYHHGRTRTLR